MSLDTLIAPLEALGFTLNEARAYAALVHRGASTGYEVGQHAGIPRSAVYGVLRRLVSAGAARSMPARDGEPERFAATAPEALVALLGKRFSASTRALEDAARALDAPSEIPDVYGVRGYDRVLEEAERLVAGARHKVVVSGWPREIAQLAPEMRKAKSRRAFVLVFSHAALPDGTPGHVFGYGLDEHALESFWKHRLVVVVDDTRSLVGATERKPTDAAVVSATEAIAELATNQIALDVTLLAQRTGDDVEPVMAKLLGDRVGRLDALLDGKKRGKHTRP